MDSENFVCSADCKLILYKISDFQVREIEVDRNASWKMLLGRQLGV